MKGIGMEWPSKDMEIVVRAERLEELRRKEEELAESKEEIARLRAALKPFAERVRAFNVECDDDQTVGVSLGGCRAALNALGEEA